VADQTGLSVAQIRQWEKRYGVPHPARRSNGYRVYTAEDVRRLQSIQAARAAGLRLADAIKASTAPGLPSSEDPEDADMSRAYREMLGSLGASGRAEDIPRVLSEAVNVLGAARGVRQVLRPFLRQVGDWWAAGHWIPAQEHLTTEACRLWCLDWLRSAAPPRSQPLALCSPAPGDRHDLPVIMVAMELVASGIRVARLGPGPAPGALRDSVILVRPMWVVVVATASPRWNPALRGFWNTEGAGLRDMLGPHRLLVGGSGWVTRDPAWEPYGHRRPEDVLHRLTAGSPSLDPDTMRTVSSKDERGGDPRDAPRE
jgi:DNA-binding transcriptional MerR regulator